MQNKQVGIRIRRIIMWSYSEFNAPLAKIVFKNSQYNFIASYIHIYMGMWKCVKTNSFIGSIGRLMPITGGKMHMYVSIKSATTTM